MDRNLLDVINNIKKVINIDGTMPKDSKKELFTRLDKISFSYSFRAPELQYISWDDTQDILMNYFFPVISDLSIQVFYVFTGFQGSIDEYKKLVKENS